MYASNSTIKLEKTHVPASVICVVIIWTLLNLHSNIKTNLVRYM